MARPKRELKKERRSLTPTTRVTTKTSRTSTKNSSMKSKVRWKLKPNLRLRKLVSQINLSNNFSTVGYGATSVVYKAVMEATNSKGIVDKEKVAVKKVKNIFESPTYAHRILREIRLLRLL